MRCKLTIALALMLLAASFPAARAAGLSPSHAARGGRARLSARSGNRHGLIAPRTLCPGQTGAGTPLATQRTAMRCMVDYARRRVGLAPLSSSAELNRSAEEKSADILRCDSFSHYACGRGPTFWMTRVGYIPSRCWRVGENLAWGRGRDASVRSLFRELIHSPVHRENILGHYSQLGVGLRSGRLDGHSRVHVLTQHFGTHC